MAKTLSGIFPALVTPFQKGKLSLSGLKSNIKKLNRFDFTGYVVLGSTGEGILMDEKEGLRAIETVRAAAAPGKIVIAGTGSESSSGTIEFSNKAAQAGADYSLVVTPFYYKAQMTAAALEAYYREVADKSEDPHHPLHGAQIHGPRTSSTDDCCHGHSPECHRAQGLIWKHVSDQ